MGNEFIFLVNVMASILAGTNISLERQWQKKSAEKSSSVFRD